MAYKFNPGTESSSNAFPPSYEAATGQHASLSGELNFIDFLPQCIDQGGLFSKAVFEPFKVLIDRANAWLQSMPTWEAKTCESVEFKTRSSEISYEKMTFYEHGEHYTWYIRGLRLWIVPRSDSSRPFQQIGYANVVPERLSNGNFETLNAVIERYNSILQSRPIPGRILTVETQEMKLSNGYKAFDPDKSLWVRHMKFAKIFIFVIRVFFEVAEPANEVIGIASFVPNALKEGGLFSSPMFEPFSNVIGNAFQWCAQQQGIRFCNAQSVEIKMKSGYVIDTQRMSYTEHSERRIYYLRVLRVAFTKSLPHSIGYMPSCPPVLNLTCKKFLPVQIGTSALFPKFETLSETRQRVVAWVKATGARIVSAETCAIRTFSFSDADYDGSFTHNRPKAGEHWIFAIRLYLDGFYVEPPAEVLPPLPQLEDSGCVIW